MNPTQRGPAAIRGALAAALSALVFWAGPALAQGPSGSAPPDAAAGENPSRPAADVVAGKALFLAHCAACHGALGEGNGPVPALGRQSVRERSDAELFGYLTSGSANGDMPAWSAIPAADRWNIVAYVRTLPDSSQVRRAAPADAATRSAPLVAPPPRAPFTDFRYEHPGVVRRITVADLPAPYATAAAENAPTIVARPKDAWPQVPHGFRVRLYASRLDTPRVIRVAPNGDVFVAETGAGRIRVFRGIRANGRPRATAQFATDLHRPYGIAFWPQGADPQWVYVADTRGVRRFPYRSGDLVSRAGPQPLLSFVSDRGHWTRDIAFSRDGATLFVAVGSASNVTDPDTSPDDRNRAAILAYDPDGTHERVYASGIRNPSGLAVDPQGGRLWCSVNERDGLGDDLVPDYVTSVTEGGFYGWPWWYLGGHQDPRHAGRHPELQALTLTPDVLVQAHSATLQLAFYDADAFPAGYRGDVFVTAHGSWNRSVRAGYEVIRIPRHQTAQASGEYEDFMTGFVLPGGQVWGRPVGIAVTADGALLVSDDASGSIWRIDHTGR